MISAAEVRALARLVDELDYYQLLELERTTDVMIVDTGAGIGANSMAFAAALICRGSS